MRERAGADGEQFRIAVIGEAIELDIGGLEEVGELGGTLRERNIRIDRNLPEHNSP